MLLLDHFHPPVSRRRPWSGFHSLWASSIATRLNIGIPEGFFAQPSVHFGIEVDVAALDERDEVKEGRTDGDRRWSLVAPSASVPFAIESEETGVRIFETGDGLTLAGAIEIVSPANKKSSAQRDAFNAKCEALLRGGVGVVVIDVVTERLANLHEELLGRLNRGAEATPGDPGLLSATSYRPTADRLDYWREVLAIKGDLPDLPLWLKAGPCLTIELASTYRQTCLALNFPETW